MLKSIRRRKSVKSKPRPPKLIRLQPNSCWTFKHPFGEVTMYLPCGNPDSISPERALWLLEAAKRSLLNGDVE